jgi:hypothetical protein
MAVAALLGAATGLGIFAVSRLTGALLYTLVGALVGLAAAVALRPYAGRARLSSLKITVPHVSELTFVVDDDARQVAWRLYVEAATRVSTQPLASTDGSLREALTSLYGLFATTRESLKASHPSASRTGTGHTVEYLAITMLNRELRPFLSKWHPLLRDYELAHAGAPEAGWAHNDSCRADLDRVRINIVDYALGFAQLAGARDAASMLSTSDT